MSWQQAASWQLAEAVNDNSCNGGSCNVRWRRWEVVINGAGAVGWWQTYQLSSNRTAAEEEESNALWVCQPHITSRRSGTTKNWGVIRVADILRKTKWASKFTERYFFHTNTLNSSFEKSCCKESGEPILFELCAVVIQSQARGAPKDLIILRNKPIGAVPWRQYSRYTYILYLS